MSNQQEAGETMQSDQHSISRPNAAFIPAAANHEKIMVSGALQVSEDSSFQTASQGQRGSVSEESVARRTSLEDLELVPSSFYRASPRNDDAVFTALPISNDEEFRSVDSNANVNRHPKVRGALLQEAVGPVPKSYASTIDNLSLHLPHLKNIKLSSRQKDISVTCYDYLDESCSSIQVFTVVRPSEQLENSDGVSLQQHLEGVQSKTLRLRLIVANDLSTDLIECLDRSLSTSPEVYEEHLVNSGWHNGIYNDQQPET